MVVVVLLVLGFAGLRLPLLLLVCARLGTQRMDHRRAAAAVAASRIIAAGRRLRRLC